MTMFRYEIGQRVWLEDDGRAAIDAVKGRKFEEKDNIKSITYYLENSSPKDENQLFGEAFDLVLEFLSDVDVDCAITELDGKTMEKRSWLHDLCGRFIDDHRLKDKDSVWASDEVTAKEIRAFIQKICETIGYYDPPGENE